MDDWKSERRVLSGWRKRWRKWSEGRSGGREGGWRERRRVRMKRYWRLRGRRNGGGRVGGRRGGCERSRLGGGGGKVMMERKEYRLEGIRRWLNGWRIVNDCFGLNGMRREGSRRRRGRRRRRRSEWRMVRS